jgi:hypothetical protein
LRRRVEALLALHDEAGDFLRFSPIDRSSLDATAGFDEARSPSGDLSELSAY